MEFEKFLQQAEASLEKLNDKDLKLQACIEIYKEGLKNIQAARELLDKAKLEIEQIDE
ncbi:exodeoxyribonuclease VII small subunit [Campylobacter insulaenigrae]|uniref:Exodeoxyribonuclease VII, small subunit n=2 Tax=Campylobacter insulaenigrae TaxID=260714 RepID=A0A0A8H1S3_9BACT|nr:exodeoxyribonuclease VII small subunit [Campylobacter insulaenigrae]AJC88083.1 exodeoxyribonuclease VII, small subunit [Campylobacter insulaenigrae NCTC 12927]MCR6570753.1 exodeoxyribonuclease VII small subunit [Campylobacter insulaenigrae]MCR6572741.1 exodeoxyribonuclease VII small subunit [Campylobacter insulaenigrae]MCR6573561.1 exodeoxyribonuclease VII small subunit [Campylobacter insulaenigrae]MCR6575621.1 exodeoxyribonuclease VII small subunit [Campylobacter insulaenigrae]